MQRVLISLLLLSAALCQAQRPTPPQPPDLSKLPTVQSVEVEFHTNDEDKDPDTQLITDFRCGDSVFASSQIQSVDARNVGSSFWLTYLDSFSDNSTTPWVSVPVQSKVFKESVHRCTTKVRIDPNGHDTWHFNYWVRLHYSDNTMDEYHYDGHALSEKVRENIFPLR